MTDPLRLNLGCGRDIRDGWVNVDSYELPGVDVVCDLDDHPKLPYDDNTVDEVYASHLIEHLWRPLPLLEELWRITKPDARAVFRCPYGSSDDADEDPTHVRRMFVGSWGYFSQPFYWNKDYGYRGDWRVARIHLWLSPYLSEISDEEAQAMLRFERNVIAEMVAVLTPVKPAREPRRDLQEPPVVVFERIKATT
jgi:SAM-dependent methyltransferase